MKTRNISRRTLLLSAAAATASPSGLIAQTPDRDLEGGIGGTGIVGLLTEFGSLIVSGNYIKTDGTTAFTDGFGPIRESDVKLGDSLTVEASNSGNGLTAKRVHVTHPLIGRITAFSPDQRVFTINGVKVTFANPVRSFAVGDHVAVSGLWRGNDVIGSTLTKARAPFDLVSGDLIRGGQGTKRISGVDVLRKGLNRLDNGSFVTAIGKYNATSGLFVATSQELGRFTGAAGALKRLSIEGYLDPIRSAPGYKISGLGHSFKRSLNLAKFENDRVLFNGAYTGKFEANAAIILPEAPRQRVKLLGDLSRKQR